jgi:hypothetical protein
VTDNEELFLNILGELKERLKKGTAYDLIRASAILRQLMVDGSSSLHVAINRNYKEKVRFEVKKWEPTTASKGKLQMQTVLPSNSCETEKINLDDFLKRKCLYYNEHTYTVKNIIQIVANIKGGVHSGTPKFPAEQALEHPEFKMLQFAIDGSDPADLCTGQIKAIGIVSLHAFEILENKVNAKKQAEVVDQ